MSNLSETNKSNDNWSVLIDSWFQHNVYLSEDQTTVTKTPRQAVGTSTALELKNAISTHEEYLQDYLLDSTVEVDSEHWYRITQAYMYEATPIDLLVQSNPDVEELLAMGATMQEKEKILFDLLWMEGQIQAFGHWLENNVLTRSVVKPVVDSVVVPVSAQILKYLYNVDPTKVTESYTRSHTITAHNILHDKKSNIRFCDPEYRPFVPKKIKDLFNHPWKRITAYALKQRQLSLKKK